MALWVTQTLFVSVVASSQAWKHRLGVKVCRKCIRKERSESQG